MAKNIYWLRSYEKQVKDNIRYQEIVQKKIDAIKTKQSLIELRKDWVNNQKKINYRNEYQRLIGDLSHSMLKGHTVHNIERRMKELQSLSDESLGKVGKGETLSYEALLQRLS